MAKSGRSCSTSILLFGLLVVLAGFLMMKTCGGSASSSNSAVTATISSALAYLKEVPEISWVEFEGNEAYLGFSTIPDDFEAVVNLAALNANRAIGRGAHVWAVDANKAKPGWRPGDAGFICEATARHGKVEDSSCGR